MWLIKGSVSLHYYYGHQSDASTVFFSSSHHTSHPHTPNNHYPATVRSSCQSIIHTPDQTQLHTHLPLFPHRSAKTANLSWRASNSIIIIIIWVIFSRWTSLLTTLPRAQSVASSRLLSWPSATLMKPAWDLRPMCIQPVSLSSWIALASSPQLFAKRACFLNAFLCIFVYSILVEGRGQWRPWHRY